MKTCLALSLLALGLSIGVAAQEPPQSSGPVSVNYVVGPRDVLLITDYDQTDMSGKFTVEADGTFTFPLIGRFTAGGLTLREIEDKLKARLVADGYFRNPQLTVSIDQYKSQKVFIVGEVRQPGTYPLSGNMTLVEVLALAGSTLPSSSGEAVIVHAGEDASGPTLPDSSEDDGTNIVRVNLRDLQNGAISQNAGLMDGDTVFVPRAESVYVFGEVKNPGAYPLQQRNTTVLQALALAGGVTDRGATGRITIVRAEDDQTKEIRVTLTDLVQPGDTIRVPQRFF
jgi:polysaccharide export outer membrane protein